MNALRILCFFGLHPFKERQFVGTSWQPYDYIRVCRGCGLEV